MRGLLIALLALAGCGGGGDSVVVVTFGLDNRVEVTTLTFPTGLPQPGPLTATRAFPNLGFNRPVVLTAPADGTNRIFIAEQNGRIYVFDNDPGVAARSLFLDISGPVSRASNEEGLLGLAFHPDYRTNGFFYVYYSMAGPRRSRLSRFTVSAGNPNAADVGSEVVLLEFNQPAGNHNGGCLVFGPDGKLYVASGDGGSANDPQNNAQNLGNLLGKILRLNDDGSIPADNPFVGQAGTRGEIWAYGLRNPWRISFDRNTGDLWCGDVGQNAVEEIDLIQRGANYGWRVYEGDRSNINPGSLPPTAFTQPIATYSHAFGFSVTGGNVYRGSRQPSLVGAYLYADYVTNRVWALVWDGNQVVSNEQVMTARGGVSTFGEDEAGELYFCSFDGNIYEFQASGGGAPAVPQTLSATGIFSNTAALVPAPGVIEYDVNSPLWSDGARKRRWIAVPGTSRITFHPTDPWSFPVGTVLVKHFELDLSPTNVQRLETRVLVHHDAGWQGYTYRWNAQQTDANLLAGAETAVFTVEDPQAPGGQRDQTWMFPSRADCMTCHTSASGRVLGVRTRQINGDFAFRSVTDNQLRAWNHISLFSTDIGDPTLFDAMPDPADTAASTADRARAYLAANCAMCHLPNGPTPVNIDLRYGIPTAQMNTHNLAASSGGVRLVPGTKEASVLWQRIGLLGAQRMPPLGSNVVDDDGLALIGLWIDLGGG